ncbi:MAG: hypothetical protein WBC92_01410 [Terracidiphilus sp.]
MAKINKTIGGITAQRSNMNLPIPERGYLATMKSPPAKDGDYREQQTVLMAVYAKRLKHGTSSCGSAPLVREISVVDFS